MKFLGFKSCQADPDFWVREAVKPDGSQYWEYVLLYVDDCLVISDNGEKILRKEIGKYFKLKEASIGPTEYVRGLRFKLRRMGIACLDPTFVYADNQYVLANTTMPMSMLKKKADSIAYHFVREGCTKDEWRTTYVNTHENPSDILTKPLPSEEKRLKFSRMLLHHL